MRKDSKDAESTPSNSTQPPRGRIDRRTFLGAAALTGTTMFAGCSGDSDGGSGVGTGTPQQGGTLQWGGAVPVQGLDPHIDTSAASKRVLENIYEEVVALQDDYSIEPHLAKSFEQSDDN